MKDVFAVESEVAQEIADSLEAKLSPAEANVVASAPTKDPAAYDSFLKGEFEQRAALNALTPELFDQAITWYQEAIARDPKFALAMARLAVCRMRRHWSAESATESELIEIGKIAKDALTLAPNLADAHVALEFFTITAFVTTSQPWRSLNVRSNCNLTTLRRCNFPLTYIAGKGNGTGLWKDWEDRSSKTRAMLRSRETLPRPTVFCGSGKKPRAQLGMAYSRSTRSYQHGYVTPESLEPGW